MKNNNSKLILANAIIYNEEGRFLLEYLKNKNGEIEYLNFYESRIELQNLIKDALESKFHQEFNFEECKVECELIRFKNSIEEVFYECFAPNLVLKNKEILEVNGKFYALYSLAEFVGLPLSSKICENISNLLHITKKVNKNAEFDFEEAVLKYGKLRKKNERVYYSVEIPTLLNMQLIILIKELARFREIPVSRICLHSNDENNIHEMLMIHTQQVIVGPLKQNKSSLSYHMLSGIANIELYNDLGERTRKIRIDSTDKLSASSVRLDASIFRSIQTISNYSIFLEIASGPFSDNDTVWFFDRY